MDHTSIHLSANVKWLIEIHKLYPLDDPASKSSILEVDFGNKIINLIQSDTSCFGLE